MSSTVASTSTPSGEARGDALRTSPKLPDSTDPNTMSMVATGFVGSAPLVRHGFRSAVVRRHTSALADLFRAYRADGTPIEVSFRKLVGPIPVNDLTHSLYPYPARLLRQIPRFFLRCDQLVGPDTVVLDPFCGSGTVLVEAHAAGLTSCGIDSNPFARLLSRVKTTPLDSAETLAAGMGILRRGKTTRTTAIPDVVNVDLWYGPSIKRALGRLRYAILEAKQSAELHRFMLVCLAIVADRCSLRDPRIPVPVRHRAWKDIRAIQKPIAVWKSFEAVVRRAAMQTATLGKPGSATAVVSGTNACSASAIYPSLSNHPKRPSLVLTSPPYGAAQKYIRSTSLALGWTGLATATQLRQLEQSSIGREHLRRDERDHIAIDDETIRKTLRSVAARSPIRASIYAHYFNEMDTALAEIATILKPGGWVILIGGSNTVAGEALPTHRLLKTIASRHGLHVTLTLRDKIKGRVLITKRASVGKPLGAETIYVLSKDER